MNYSRTLFLLVSILLLTVKISASLCSICVSSVQKVQQLAINVVPISIANQVVKAMCLSKFESDELCQHLADELTPLAVTNTILGVLKEGRICESVCGDSFYKPFNGDIEASPSQQEQQLQIVSQQIQLKLRGNAKAGSLRVLHLSDVHLDLNYTEGASTECGLPICCRKSSTQQLTSQSVVNPAPKYGSIRCDTPLALFQSFLDWAPGKFDLVVVTGDNSAHNEWEKSENTVLEVRNYVESKLRERLQVPVISVPGNNEYYPDHQANAEAVEESINVYDVDSLTFIALNTLLCDNINLNLIRDQTHSLRQLRLLDKVLSVKQNVYIFAHINPETSSCSSPYQKEFLVLLDKHSNKIRGQFYGHTHLDQLLLNTVSEVNEGKEEQQAVTFAFTAPSFSPLFTNVSRCRAYQIDVSTGQVLDYSQYRFKTNSWVEDYTFKEYYGLNSYQFINIQAVQFLAGQIMRGQQNARTKYVAKRNGVTVSEKSACEIFDSTNLQVQCCGQILTSSISIAKIIELLQGPWGQYGNRIE